LAAVADRRIMRIALRARESDVGCLSVAEPNARSAAGSLNENDSGCIKGGFYCHETARMAEVTDSIYASLQANNADIDAHIATLKAALSREGMKEAVFDPARLAQNNRSGRKLMQAYFRQRGVSVKFST